MQGDLIFPALEYGVVPLLGVSLAEALENLLRRTNKKAGNGANQQIAETDERYGAMTYQCWTPKGRWRSESIR